MHMFVCQSDASMHGLLPRRNRVRCIGVRSPHLSCHDLGMESWLGLKQKDRPTRRWSAFPLSNRHRNLWHLIGGRDGTEDPTDESIRRRGKDALGSHTIAKLGTSAFPLRVTLVSRDSILLPIIPIDGRSLCPAPPEPILCKSCSFGCFLPHHPQARNPDYPFRVEESPPECLTTPLSFRSNINCLGDIQTTGYIGKGRSCVRCILTSTFGRIVCHCCTPNPRFASPRASTHVAMAATACTMNLAMAKPARKTFQGNKGADAADRRRRTRHGRKREPRRLCARLRECKWDALGGSERKQAWPS